MDCSHKQAIFPQYKFPNAKTKYAQVADELNLGGNNDDEKVELLIQAVDRLMKAINLPNSIERNCLILLCSVTFLKET